MPYEEIIDILGPASKEAPLGDFGKDLYYYINNSNKVGLALTYYNDYGLEVFTIKDRSG